MVAAINGKKPKVRFVLTADIPAPIQEIGLSDSSIG